MILLYERLLARRPSEDEVAGQIASGVDWRGLLQVIVDSDEYAAKRGMTRTAPPQPLVNIHTPELAPHGHQPGAVSADGVAEVGLDGQLFIVGGSNSVLDQVLGTAEIPEGWEAGWSAVAEERRAQAASLGLAVATIVVPDKLSIVPQLFSQPIPAEVDTPVKRVRRLWPELLYPVDAMGALGTRGVLATDSHLTVDGNRAIARVLGEALGVDLGGNRELDRTDRVLSGDLGSKFDPPIVEISDLVAGWGTAELTFDNSREVFATGRHVGTRLRFVNREAPDQRTAVLFGDSYGFAGPAYQGLAWFIAQGFAESYFYWVPFGWDTSLIEELGASVVISEGAERFVLRPPQNTIDDEAR
ncbi:MAG TPA: hypothetical protein PKB03_03615 [Baekduia sp.]|nr:hypothetical protein [Baekduia sp.]